MQIVRKKLSADELTPAGTRYNPDTGAIQQTPDGGTTWVDNPGLDPRIAPGVKLPPNPTENPKCDAAARMTAAIKGMVDTAIAQSGFLQMANALLAAIFFFLPGYGILIDFLLIVAEALVALGTEAIDAAMTEEVYDTLTCIFLCHVEEDGSITQSGVDDVYDDVVAQLTGIAVTVIGEMLNMFGANGLSNASVLRDETGSCDDCDACAWCYEWTTTQIPLGDFSGVHQGSLSNFPATGFTLSDGAITHIEFTFTFSGVGVGGDSAAAIWVPAATRVLLVAPLNSLTSPATLTWDGSVTSPGDLQVGANGAAGSGEVITITHILVRGTGTLPAWTHGSEC